MVSIGPVESVKLFQGRGVFHHPPDLGGGHKEANHDYYDFSQISLAGVV